MNESVDRMVEQYFKKHGIDKNSRLYKDYYDFNIRKAPQRARTIADYVEVKTGISDFTGKLILDVGCGTGHVADEFARRGATAYGVEKDKELVDVGNALHKNSHPTLIDDDFLSDSLMLNLSFDIILMIDVIEHVKQQKELISKATSLLESGGKLVIVTPNRLCPYDPEYGLFFVNYMPKRIADCYVRAMGGENTVGGKEKGFGVYPLTVFALKKLMRSAGIDSLDVEVGTEFIAHRSEVLSKFLGHFKKNPLLLAIGSPLSIVGTRTKAQGKSR